MPQTLRFDRGVMALCTAIFLLSCADLDISDDIDPEPAPYRGTLGRVQAEGVLRVIVPDKDYAALPRSGRALALELDMAQRLAARLGVELVLVQAARYDSIVPWLAGGKGDVAMATLTITESRQEAVDFSIPVDHVREMLVGRTDAPAAIGSLADLAGHTVVVRRSSSYFGTLEQVRETVPELIIQAAPEDMHTHDIAHKVAGGDYPMTVCDEDIAAGVMQYEDNLAVVLPLTDPRPRAWAVGRGCDSLRVAVNQFIMEEALAVERSERFTGDLDGIRERRYLRVATRNNAATYWIYRGQEVGFEYELSRAFAEQHGLRLYMRIAPSRDVLLDWVARGKADIAAASLTITDDRRQNVAFGAPYLFPEEVIVSGRDESGEPLVNDVADLMRWPVHVRRSSSYYETLMELERELGEPLDIRLVPEHIETEEILRRVSIGKYAATVCDDFLAEMEAQYTDAIAIGPALTGQREIGWAMRPDAVQLKKAVDEFFTTGSHRPRSLYYNMLYRRYFATGKRVAMARSEGRTDVHGRISPYDDLIQRYAAQHGLDWRMIAAQMFQESRFDPNARSWAGAKGLMQLMPRTALELGVSDITDPDQNIRGGTQYMARLLARFDPGLPYRQRFHLALASYNAGYGHVLDARRLAAQKGWDPNQWFGNVEQAMLLLSTPEYASRARHGFVRGYEPVTYVANIQALYNHYSQLLYSRMH